MGYSSKQLTNGAPAMAGKYTAWEVGRLPMKNLTSESKTSSIRTITSVISSPTATRSRLIIGEYVDRFEDYWRNSRIISLKCGIMNSAVKGSQSRRYPSWWSKSKA